MLVSSFLRRRAGWLLLISASFTLALTHGGPLEATPIALAGVVFGQLWLPGLLVLRVLGKAGDTHPLARLPWILAAGLGFTIPLGAIAHVTHVPIPTYVVLLHGALLLLALLPAKPAIEVEPHPKLTRRALPVYGLLILCCCLAAGVASERNAYRFTGYEDQTFFIANADWLVHFPNEIERTSRQAGQYGDRRFETDGWTYAHAAWSWSSGVNVDRLIWSDLTWLFAWITPLAVFALAYEGTRRESAAVFSAAGLVLAALLLLDPFAYVDDARVFGQNALFQVNTLRTFSTTVMLPLALMLLLAHLRRPAVRSFVLLALVGGALAVLHPRQIIYFGLLIAACGGLWFVTQPTRARLGAVVVLALLTLSLLLLPSWQYFVPDTLRTLFIQAAPNPPPTAESASKIPAVLPPTIPTFSAPAKSTDENFESVPFFYHPVLIGITIISLIAAVRWRRDLLSLYVASATLVTLLFVFTPGWSEFVTRIFDDSAYGISLIGWATVMLPVGPALGLAIEAVLKPLGKHSLWFGTLAIGVVFGLLLFEPIPIPASARDQIRSANALQALRDRPAFDSALLAVLVRTLPPDTITTVLTSNALSGAVNETIPSTLVVTGRNTTLDLVYEQGMRFYDPAVPWLDSLDLAFIDEIGVTYLVLAVTDSRLTQVELSPDRFERIGEAAGYRVYRVIAPNDPGAIDERFRRMNELLTAEPPQRYQGELALAVAGDPRWRPLLAEWQTEAEGGSDRALYGLALSALLTGDDAQALPLWRDLHTRYPDIPFFGLALAATLREAGQAADAAAVLLQMANAEPVGLLAVRTLLTSDFFYLLSAPDIERLIALTEAAPTIWSQIAEYEQPVALRQRVGLFMRFGLYAQARDWLERIPPIRQTPDDLLTLSLLDLGLGEHDSALRRLQPSEDADAFVPNRAYNPEAWQTDRLLVTYEAMQRGAADSLLQALHAPTLPLLSLSPHVGPQQVEIQARVVDLPLLPAQGWRARLLSPDGQTSYAEREIAPVPTEPGQIASLNFTLDIPGNLPDLSPVRVVVQPIYADGLEPLLTADLWLPLPPSAEVPDAARLTTPVTFGETIRLLAAESRLEGDRLALTLYWQPTAEAPDDLQVFVHVLDTNGTIVVQQDARPVDNRYPFHVMPVGNIVRDQRYLPITDLTPGDYRVIVGIYRLGDQTRLSVQGTNVPQSDHAEIWRFLLEG